METVWIGTATEQHPTMGAGERQILRNILFYRYRAGKVIETREFGVPVNDPEAPTG